MVSILERGITRNGNTAMEVGEMPSSFPFWKQCTLIYPLSWWLGVVNTWATVFSHCSPLSPVACFFSYFYVGQIHSAEPVFPTLTFFSYWSLKVAQCCARAQSSCATMTTTVVNIMNQYLMSIAKAYCVPDTPRAFSLNPHGNPAKW